MKTSIELLCNNCGIELIPESIRDHKCAQVKALQDEKVQMAKEFCKDWPYGTYHPNDFTLFFEKGFDACLKLLADRVGDLYTQEQFDKDWYLSAGDERAFEIARVERIQMNQAWAAKVELLKQEHENFCEQAAVRFEAKIEILEQRDRDRQERENLYRSEIRELERENAELKAEVQKYMDSTKHYGDMFVMSQMVEGFRRKHFENLAHAVSNTPLSERESYLYEAAKEVVDAVYKPKKD